MSAPVPATAAASAASLPWWLRGLARLPLPVLYALCGALASVSRVLPGSRWQVTLSNLRTVFPQMPRRELRSLAAANHRHFADLAAELVAGCRMSRGQLLARVQLRNLDLLRARLAHGRPVLLLGAH